MARNKLRVMLSDTYDPWFNLATEDWIFQDVDPETRILFLWRNQDTVVIGRFQNPWVECNVEKMETDGIKLARRQSGGGAVYHDLGNTNFTFLNGQRNFDKSVNNKIITNALKKFDINASPSGRNDIVIDPRDGEGPRKISGSAFKQKKDRSFHHGTLLIDADLSKLAQYLMPHKKKLVAKGIKSVRSRVANLREYHAQLDHEALIPAIIHEFFDYYQSDCPIEHLNHQDLKQIKALEDHYQQLKDWKWRFGETPQFTHNLVERFDWGMMDVHIDGHKGMIKDCAIFSDSLHPELVEGLMGHLKGVPYGREGVEMAQQKALEELPFMERELQEFADWLKSELK